MNFNAITISDIAKALNLSASTVSKALSDSYEISAKTKKLVVDYARENNYRPNPIAQSLKKGKSKSIGIVVPTIDNQFFSQVINGIESVAYEEGYNVIITQTHESYDVELLNINALTHRSIDGMLLSLSTETFNVDHLQKLQNQGLPIVFFDRVSDTINTHKVIADNFKGGYEATMHLIESGFKYIAHITSPAHTSITRERLAGYKKALTDKGFNVDDNYIKYCSHGGKSIAETKEAMDELLALPVRPDAIFAASDRITTTVLSLLHKSKIKIPAEMGLVGFNNTNLAELLNPALTAVHQPAFEIGKKATEMLLSIIKSRYPVTEFETVVMPTELFIRKSSVRD
ncbi:LacI family DNA-binding transcriptional regulator [Mucilaginibacter glaciei]|uniref:LacI family DNA-binding transcriptional regulator n=1 Tax=Mucilaginibacter glaciei TaxID=2772109 RepID=A0A926S1V7_9SPHI|nr:LacI family DNA-binding transcriptional regulator [Mucilaginibacter glaciei]MBD1393222.1 LacI family DNA-binding transcriptional regulator [Mucilaginibacter glaciei]